MKPPIMTARVRNWLDGPEAEGAKRVHGGTAIGEQQAMVKRFESLGGETPAREAAPVVLGEYLKTVKKQSRHIEQGDEDPVHAVHQLRVGARRVAASLRAFADFFPAKSVRKLKRKMKKLRRAAGETRNLDVLIADLHQTRQELPADDVPALDLLIAQVRIEREQCFHELRERVVKLHRKEFWDWTERKFSQSIEVEIGDILLTLARSKLQQALDHFFERHEASLGRGYAALHQVRISGKRLRYSMDVFAGCFGPSFMEDLYVRLTGALDLLGRLNDLHTFAERFQELASRIPEEQETLRGQTGRLARRYEKRRREPRRQFESFWNGQLGNRFYRQFLEAIEDALHPFPDSIPAEG